MARIAPLDGLRGVACLTVLVGHADIPHVPSFAHAGVDAFFTLSGFLIAGILLREHERTGTIRLGEFYLRRMRRLVPALAVTLFAVVLYDGLAKPGGGIACPYLLTDVAMAAGYMTNLSMAHGWPHRLSTDFLPHAWSLSAEEQFYTVAPVALFATLRLGATRAALFRGCLCLIVAAIGWKAWLVASGATVMRVYCSPDAHVDPLLIGVAGAIANDRVQAWFADQRRLLAWGALGSVVAAAGVAGMMEFPTAARSVTVATTTALATLLVIYDVTAPGRSYLRGVLAWRPLVVAGLGSYGLYLYHYPLYVVCGPVAGIVLTVAAAGASYRWIEMPVREWRRTPLAVTESPAVS